MDIFTVYKIKCLVTDKLYIGYTKQKIAVRLSQHFKKAFNKNKTNIKFHNAIRKHGKNNFIIEIIDTFSTQNEAILFEIACIKNFNTITDGYNTTTGGDGGVTKLGPLSDEHKDKISNALKGRKFSDEHRDNIKKNHHNVSGSNNPMFGKTTSGSFKSGSAHPRSKPIIVEGVLYESMNIASKTLKLHPTTIIKRYFNDVQKPL